MAKFKYLISYAHTGKLENPPGIGHGFGCTVIATNTKVEDQIATNLSAFIKNMEEIDGVRDIVILNFKRL